MDTMTGMLLIVAACAAVLIISVMRRKAAFLLRFLVRMIIGAFAIMATNSALATAGLSVFVGLNGAFSQSERSESAVLECFMQFYCT